MKKMSKKKVGVIIGSVVVLLILCVGGYFMFFSGHYVNVNGQSLNKFSMSTGGSMTGYFKKTTVTRYDDERALLTIQVSRSFLMDPEVREYFIDVKCLDEIQSILSRYHMNFWNNKEFYKGFAADGESYTYTFQFDSERVFFSSQYYPKRYREKLQKIDDVLFFYGNEPELLPALVVPRPADNDVYYEYYTPQEGEAALYVNKYGENMLYYTLVNDSEESVELTGLPVIRNKTDGTVVY
ncbi:MAG: hypothetical protein HUJ69_08190, partial [Lachnospiraceae bacterium]|nr:hypothetical protein [Lachnospiraceae bacterium]